MKHVCLKAFIVVRSLCEEDGQDLIEYALVVALTSHLPRQLE